MRFVFVFIPLLILVGCSSKFFNKISIKNSVKNFSYADETGKFFLKRSVIVKSNKIFTKTVLFSTDEPDREVEKIISVSQIGYLKSKNNQSLMISRPVSSQYEVWYEGKKYFSQLKTNAKEKRIETVIQSPVSKWKGANAIKFPSGKNFCFFNQVPECLRANGFIDQSIKDGAGEMSFYIIWNSFPFQLEQFSGLENRLFAGAKITFDGEGEGYYKFSVEVANQNIFYNFKKNGEFEKMFWVAQGITMIVD